MASYGVLIVFNLEIRLCLKNLVKIDKILINKKKFIYFNKTLLKFVLKIILFTIFFVLIFV